MKSLSDRVMSQKLKNEAKKYVDENYYTLMYEVLKYSSPKIMTDTEAMFLFALSLHGYGAKRLRDFHEWYKAIVEMPEVMGKQSKSGDCVKVLRERYGLDISDVTPNFVSFEEFMKDKEDDK